MAQLELYEVPGCPDCASVRSALDEFELDYESRTVPRSHGKRGELEDLCGQTCVPVLVDHDNGVTRTPRDGDVAAYLDETFREVAPAPE